MAFFVYNNNMMKLGKYFVGLVIILSLLAVVPTQAQGIENSRFFDQTRHNVQWAFWQYYQSVPDAEVVLGYPITEQFTNRDGVLVQYFQRARLETQNGQVRLSPLGRLTYKVGVQLKINNSLACRQYDTGFSVCFAFLDFFDIHGGVTLLGRPISSFEFQDNMIVQYFENGRLEWHASNPEGQRVVMGNLGSIYFKAINEDSVRLTGIFPPTNTIGSSQVLSLKVRAFPWKAVTYSTDQQVIFIVVQDQTLQPVGGATGNATVKWTTGTVGTFPIVTDAKGIATLALPVADQAYGGLVTIDVQVTHGELNGQTSTSFRIWY